MMEFFFKLWPVLLLGLGILTIMGFHIVRSSHPLGTLSLYCRLILGIIFVSSGLGKLSADAARPFLSLIGPVQLEALLRPHGLGLFAQFIGYSQVGVGLLLFSQRFSLVGAIMLLPMQICILIVTIAMDFQGTPSIVSGLILLNLMIFVVHRQRLQTLLLDNGIQFDRIDLGWALSSLAVLSGISAVAASWEMGRHLVKLGLLGLVAAGVGRRIHSKRSKSA